MKVIIFLFVLIFCIVFVSCSGDKLEEKGFAVSSSNEDIAESGIEGDTDISLNFETRPGSVLLTDNSQLRLTPVYKVNYNKKEKTTFIGTNAYHVNYSYEGEINGNQWNYNFMPGIEAVYGYNMVNISHYNTEKKSQKNFFEKPVLIKTVYFPSFSNDTLNYEPIKRDYYIISLYDEDTNKDGVINMKDLRRIYYFDMNAENKTPLVPVNYSVFKSEYDSGNDFMYIYAQLDENGNGKRDESEPNHIFWIDLKDPLNNGLLY